MDPVVLIEDVPNLDLQRPHPAGRIASLRRTGYGLMILKRANERYFNRYPKITKVRWLTSRVDLTLKECPINAYSDCRSRIRWPGVRSLFR